MKATSQHWWRYTYVARGITIKIIKNNKDYTMEEVHLLPWAKVGCQSMSRVGKCKENHNWIASFWSCSNLMSRFLRAETTAPLHKTLRSDKYKTKTDYVLQRCQRSEDNSPGATTIIHSLKERRVGVCMNPAAVLVLSTGHPATTQTENDIVITHFSRMSRRNTPLQVLVLH